MGSNYYDVGQAHASVYRSIPSNLDSMSMEEMKALLRGIKEDSGESYADYAVFMGWHETNAEAMESLSEKDSIDVVDPVENTTVLTSLFIVKPWFATKKGLPKEFFTWVNTETEKCFLTERGWIPKSQIASKRDLLWRVHPCQDSKDFEVWFNKHLPVGQSTRLVLRGASEGRSINVDGIVEAVESNEIIVDRKRCSMSEVSEVYGFKSEGEENLDR